MRIAGGRRLRSFITVASIIIFLAAIRNSGPSEKLGVFGGSEGTLSQKFIRTYRGEIDAHARGVSGSQAARHLLATREDEGDLQEDAHLKVSWWKNTSLDSFSRNESLLGSSTCARVQEHKGYNSSCAYVKAISQCSSGTLIEYAQVFYCFFGGGSQTLAYGSLFLWLVILFYLLGNTAADFFCPSIAELAKLLHLPGTVAGVTLLPFGNGAPDVFASIAAFVGGSGQGQVGLNSVLGGAIFISSVVAGSVCLMIAGNGHTFPLDKRCFLRDVGFFLFTLTALITILSLGRIHFWWAIAYLSIYAVYACVVFFVEFLKLHPNILPRRRPPSEPLLPVEGLQYYDDELEYDGGGSYTESFDQPRGFSDAEDNSSQLPQWMWAPHVQIYSQQSGVDGRQLWGENREHESEPEELKPLQRYCTKILLPLNIPRRLTIPLMEAEGWSKFYTVMSATLAPSLLALVWDGRDGGSIGSAWREYAMAGCLGLVLGVTAVITLDDNRPPRRFLFPWAAGGFVMSIVWFYLIATELVGALVALGVVLNIDASILGLTVLAWGNSVGDLISNLALVNHGGEQIQTAFSGCYAAPMFNTLVGVGLSFLFASWKTYPNAFIIPEDETIFMTMFFLILGLIWALYMLLSRNMQPTKLLGFGLLALYGCFLTIRLAFELGLSPAPLNF